MIAALLLALAQAIPQAPPLPPEPPPAPCLPAGTWADEAGRALDDAAALTTAAAARVVLLGEAHATPGIHAWQARTAAALASDGRPLVIAVEWLPRRAQAALDRYVAGTTDEAQFQAEADWKTAWRHDFAAYRPVFALARARAIPIVALNIDRAIVRTTSRDGLDAGLAAARAAGTPVGRPAPPTPAYRARLMASLAEHGPADSTAPARAERFIAAQGMWDRAMAEAIAATLAARPQARVIAMMGLGHVEGGNGVAHQLAALGHTAVFAAIPAIAGESGDCDPAAAQGHHLAGWAALPRDPA
jgi:uncharacterized iron-regulated protein